MSSRGQFSDCADTYHVTVAEHLLSESDRRFQVLLKVMTDAHTLWHGETADFGARGRHPIAFQSVLACDPDAVGALTQRISSADATFALL